MNKTIALLSLFFSTTIILPSCIGQIYDVFVREDYPGPRPAHVIADINGKPAHTRWKKIDKESLPAPSSIVLNQATTYAEDGLPYAFTSSFTYILTSPYAPYNQLSYNGFSGGDLVWDPYTKKAFYIPRIHTIN